MPSLKAVIRKDVVNSNGKANIKFSISHDGKIRYIKTPYYIDPHFMGTDGKVKKSHPKALSLNQALLKLEMEYTDIITAIGPEVAFMNISTLINKLRRNEPQGSSFIRYANERIAELEKESRFSYAESYEVTLVHLKTFTKKEDILFKDITLVFIKDFERMLKLKPCRINTIRIYLNNIRAIFNHAIENEIIRHELNPFKTFKVRKEVVKKISLSIVEVQKLRMLPYYIAQQRSVLMFLLSFYLMGMNLKDLLMLPDDAIKDGYISYKRLKIEGKQDIELKFKVIPAAMEIINMYRGKKYLLRFMDADDSYEAYKLFLKETNKRLRLAGQYAGISTRLSTGITRHTWATMAIDLDVSLSDLDLALGHNLNTITGRYVNWDKLFAKVDEANEKIQIAISG